MRNILVLISGIICLYLGGIWLFISNEISDYLVSATLLATGVLVTVMRIKFIIRQVLDNYYDKKYIEEMQKRIYEEGHL